MEIIREENRIIEKIDYLTENAVREIIAMKKPPFEMEIKSIENGNHIKSESSVKFRHIYEIGENVNSEFFNLLQIFQNEGAEIKLVSSLPVEMEIYDNQVVAEVKLFLRTENEWFCKGSQTGQMQIIKKNVGDAMKGAITDALQKCLSLLSIGSDAYKGLLRDVYHSGQRPPATTARRPGESPPH